MILIDKLPRNCRVCAIPHFVNNEIYCNITHHFVNEMVDCRDVDCPLKSIDGLIEKIIEHRNKINAGGDEFMVGQLLGIDEVTEIIKKYCEMEEEEC